MSPPNLPVTDVKQKRKKKSKNKNLESTSLTNGTPNSSDSLKADQSVEDIVMEQNETPKKKKIKVCVFLYINGNFTILAAVVPEAQWYMRVRKVKSKVFKKLLFNAFST